MLLDKTPVKTTALFCYTNGTFSTKAFYFEN